MSAVVVDSGLVSEAPTGLVALLFTDVEGSTRLAAELGAAWGAVLSEHHEIVSTAIRSHGGWIDGTEGDAFCATFADPCEAALAAVTAQRELRAHPWPEAVGELKVRMGLHVGHVTRQHTGYVGLEVHRAARVAAAAHGGQLLITRTAADLVRDVVSTQALGTHRLKDFPSPEALYCAEIDGRGAAHFPAPRTLELRPTNLPASRRVLVGRELDLARVRSALFDRHDRLVTLLGRGGVGKTSLAFAVAHEVLDEFPGGVWWVELAAETDAEGMLDAVARTLSTKDSDSVQSSIVVRLQSEGAALLVLDNLEQIASAGPALEALQDRLPDLHVLATSQRPLGIGHERRVRVEQLSEEDAVELIARSAERLGVPPPADGPALRDLVALLDGLPLALELAAGRLELLSPAQLAERVRTSLLTLRDPSGTRPGRQRSLEAALDWTLGVLDQEARTLFDRLGVFAGPVELGEIEAVAGLDGVDVLDALNELLSVALVRRVEAGDGRLRFGLPEALRQYASSRLTDAGETRWRHEHAKRQRDLTWPARVYEIVDLEVAEIAERANSEVIGALAWAWEHDRDLARQLALARASLVIQNGSLRESAELIYAVLADPGKDPAVVALARCFEDVVKAVSGRREGEIERMREIYRSTDDLHVRLLLEINTGIASVLSGAPAAGLPHFDAAIRIASQIDPVAHASAVGAKVGGLVAARRFESAREALDECDRIADGRRSPMLERLDSTRGDLALLSGETDDAIHHYTRSITTAELRVNPTQMYWDTRALAHALARKQQDQAALELIGISRAQAEDLTKEGYELIEFPFDDGALGSAVARVRPEVGEALISTGRRVPASRRVKRVCGLAFQAVASA